MRVIRTAFYGLALFIVAACVVQAAFQDSLPAHQIPAVDTDPFQNGLPERFNFACGTCMGLGQRNFKLTCNSASNTASMLANCNSDCSQCGALGVTLPAGKYVKMHMGTVASAAGETLEQGEASKTMYFQFEKGYTCPVRLVEDVLVCMQLDSAPALVDRSVSASMCGSRSIVMGSGAPQSQQFQRVCQKSSTTPTLLVSTAAVLPASGCPAADDTTYLTSVRDHLPAVPATCTAAAVASEEDYQSFSCEYGTDQLCMGMKVTMTLPAEETALDPLTLLQSSHTGVSVAIGLAVAAISTMLA